MAQRTYFGRAQDARAQKAEGMAAEQPVIGMTMEQLERILSRNQGGALTPEALEKILTSVGQSNAQAMQRSLRPENPNPPPVSVFNPTGDLNKPRLRRVTRFCGHEEDEARLTAQEIGLYNAFTANRSAHGGTWKAEILRRPNGEEALEVSVPSRNPDDRMGIPPLTQVLRELLEGEEAANPDAMADRLRAMEAELAALKAKKAAA